MVRTRQNGKSESNLYESSIDSDSEDLSPSHPKKRLKSNDLLKEDFSNSSQQSQLRNGKLIKNGLVESFNDSTVEEDLIKTVLPFNGLKRSKRIAANSIRVYVDENTNDSHTYNTRRSTRQRNFTFETWNGDRKEDDSKEDYDDMYSRVKRSRSRPEGNDYFSKEENAQSIAAENDISPNHHYSSLDEEESFIQNDKIIPKKYHLRSRNNGETSNGNNESSTKRDRPKRKANKVYDSYTFAKIFNSPKHNSPHLKKRKRLAHSSSDSSSEDEQRFEEKNNRSLYRARERCLPVNLNKGDFTKGAIRERAKIGSTAANNEIMEVDTNVKFSDIGGLNDKISDLKEMVMLPLIYPEVFREFNSKPPKGCLFHGPPGTGKTLIARALANECSQGNIKVAFFYRKGADCLSKWVGESERQLRTIFEQAYVYRPSIIFFDEIDGLAPARSSKQDQIHCSIVSSLLSLMDGLDDRGEVIVIGATNRIDSIDPALRRPGRFDKEFLFTLPDSKQRFEILKVLTKDWNTPPQQNLLETLSEKSVGYCGADLKALCTESLLSSLKSTYPQIYQSTQKLQIDVNALKIQDVHFFRAMKKIVPVSQRSASNVLQPLDEVLEPLLRCQLNLALNKLHEIFPILKDSKEKTSEDDVLIGELENISVPRIENLMDSNNIEKLPTIFLRSCPLWPVNYKPRFLLCGTKLQGQTLYIAPAILHYAEHLPLHKLDLASLIQYPNQSREESLSLLFREAGRKTPSIIYIPQIEILWNSLEEVLQLTLHSMLNGLNINSSVLVLATSHCPFEELSLSLKELFSPHLGQVLQVTKPTITERRNYFKKLIFEELLKPPVNSVREKIVLPELPLAPPPEPKPLTEVEMKKMLNDEEMYMRELRLYLRQVLNKLMKDRRFSNFVKPVDPEEVPDYHKVIKYPMDMQTMMTKLDKHKYETIGQFLKDVDLICKNALEYNPDHQDTDKYIRHKACHLKDAGHSMIMTELNDDFSEKCDLIHETRRKREEAANIPPKAASAPKKNGNDSSITASPKISPKPNEFSSPSSGDSESKKDQSFSPKLNKAKYKKSIWCRTKRKRTLGKKMFDSPEKGDSTSDNDKSLLEDEISESFNQPSNSSNPDPPNPSPVQEETRSEPKRVVSIDVLFLHRFLRDVVADTENWEIETIVSLNTQIRLQILKHSQNWDKILLSKDLSAVLNKFRSLEH